MVDEDLRYDNLARKRVDDNVRRAVIAAYTGALKSSEAMRRSAFDAALRVFRARHPDIPEGLARRQVALIICFADWPWSA